jgi:hypothetical protein
MANEANLKPVRAGEVRNPAGRPKGAKDRTTVARWVLSMPAVLPEKIFEAMKIKYPEMQKNMTIEEIALLIQANKAVETGDTKALELILNNAYKPHSQEIKSENESETKLSEAILKLAEAKSKQSK